MWAFLTSRGTEWTDAKLLMLLSPVVRRLVAVMDAVQDIPRHAMRLALWQARPKEERRPERWSPLRPGRPPGYRKRHIHEVDVILKEMEEEAGVAAKQTADLTDVNAPF